MIVPLCIYLLLGFLSLIVYLLIIYLITSNPVYLPYNKFNLISILYRYQVLSLCFINIQNIKRYYLFILLIYGIFIICSNLYEFFVFMMPNPSGPPRLPPLESPSGPSSQGPQPGPSS